MIYRLAAIVGRERPFLSGETLLMRATLLFGGLALLAAGCAAKVNPAPPPPNKQLLNGKWKNSSEFQLISGYEFAEDGTVKMTVRGMNKPVTGTYAWNGDRALDLKYRAEGDVAKAYATTAKVYKEEVKDLVKSGKLPDRAAPSILATVRDELPAEETLKVGLSEQPRLLFLTQENQAAQTFEKVE
jgi:hypothetical protein